MNSLKPSKVSNDFLSDLNQAQKKAVTSFKKQILVIAGAGTGKTAVITQRIAWLIREKKARPSEILALTFTEKAAQEMEKRVDLLVPYGFIDTWIMTFHAFGDRILREHALEVGLTSNFKIITEPDGLLFLRENLFSFDFKYFRPLNNPTKFLPHLLKFFSRIKDEDTSPEQFLKFAQKSPRKEEKLLELAALYQQYHELNLVNDQVDFGDLIVLTLKLFRENPKILKKYQKQFKYILVDEFQDTNFAQNELLKLLAGKKGNIMVVGDDDQAIYRFRGAALSNILDFTKTYPQAKIIILKENYRSPVQILDSAYRLIQFNNPDRLEVKKKISKKLVTQKQGEPPFVRGFNTDFAEATFVAKTIKEKVKAGLSFRDFSVLVRARSLTEPFIKIFNRESIPYQFAGSSGLYDQPEIRLIISFLKSLADYGDSLSFYDLATSPIFNFSPQELGPSLALARRKNSGLREILEYEIKNNVLNLEQKTKEKIETLINFLNKFSQKALEENVAKIIHDFLADSGILKDLIRKSEKSVEAAVKIENIAKFFERVQEFIRLTPNKGVFHFVENLDLLMEAGESPALAELDPDLEAVAITTVHGAKGLEFPIVFIPSLTADRFPSRERGEAIEVPEKLIKETLLTGDYHLEEERRLFYVGMTRAKEELYLTFAKRYEGNKREKKPSQFILEALDNPEILEEKETVSALEKISLFDIVLKTSALPKKFFLGEKIILSPYQIDDYLTCPKKFEYIHVLRIPIPLTHPLVYGGAIHAAIQYYFNKKVVKQKVSFDELIFAFKRAWRGEGFISRQHEEERFNQGKKTLLEFFEKWEKEKILPQKSEYKFEAPLTKDIFLRGRIDTLFKNDSKIEIIDFKTSAVDEEKKANEQTKKSIQLKVYALSFEKIEKKNPFVGLYFLESGIKTKIKFTKEDLEKTIEEIKKVVQGLKKHDFTATPSFIACNQCSYNRLCPFSVARK